MGAVTGVTDRPRNPSLSREPVSCSPKPSPCTARSACPSTWRWRRQCWGTSNLPPGASITCYSECDNVCLLTHDASGDGSRGPEGNGRRRALLVRARSRAARVSGWLPSGAAAGTTWLAYRRISERALAGGRKRIGIDRVHRAPQPRKPGLTALASVSKGDSSQKRRVAGEEEVTLSHIITFPWPAGYG